MSTWEHDPELEARVAEKWDEIAPLVETLLRRVGARDEFPVAPGSALVGDDKAATPYAVSHAVQACLSAAVDHLHAAKVLAYDSGMLHLAAPATLARGVIENAAAGVWILSPSSRDERVLRVLRWHARNFHDQAGAGAMRPGVTRDELLARVEEVAVRRGVDVKLACSGYQMLKVIKAVDREHPDLGRITFAWQLGSGFAHGRPWALLGALHQERLSPKEPGVSEIRLTNEPSLAMYPILKGLHTVERLLQLRERRAGLHRPQSIPEWLGVARSLDAESQAQFVACGWANGGPTKRSTTRVAFDRGDNNVRRHRSSGRAN